MKKTVNNRSAKKTAKKESKPVSKRRKISKKELIKVFIHATTNYPSIARDLRKNYNLNNDQAKDIAKLYYDSELDFSIQNAIKDYFEKEKYKKEAWKVEEKIRIY
jgi:hypothetical protein